MKKNNKRIVVFGILLSLFAFLFFDVSALDPIDYATAASFNEAAYSITGETCLQTIPAYAVDADFTVNTYDELIKTIVQQYVARDTDFTVLINDAGDELFDQLGNSKTFWNDVFTYDLPETTSDIYYLYTSRSGTSQAQYSMYSTYTLMRMTQSFYTTAEQEEYVDTALDSILEALALENLNPYEKVKVIHDYIVNNVEYDYTIQKFSAYEALYSGETVCNGYALLAYKMLMEADVPVKIVTGLATSGGATENHAWNVVQIGSSWYNMDVTWDDTARTTEYFLRNDTAFSDHIPAVYPDTVYDEQIEISLTDFDPTADVLYYDPAQISSWAQEDIIALIERNVVPQSIQSDFQNDMTRDEFTALMVGVYEYAKGSYALQNSSPFTDIGDSIFAEQISKGYELGLISGVAVDAFDPYGTLTREQCAKIIGSTAGLINGNDIISEAQLPFLDALSISDWALLYVKYAFENELMNGTGENFEPQGLLTREQAMVIAERMIEKYGWETIPPIQ